MPAVLDPAAVPVNEHGLAEGVVFARDYAALLKFYNAGEQADGDWTPFFGSDVAVQLAIASLENLDDYKTAVQAWFAYLNQLSHQADEALLKEYFGYLFGAIATLAKQLDAFKDALPVELSLRDTLINLIRVKLEPAFARLIAYYRAARTLSLVNESVPQNIRILRQPAVSFASVLNAGLSNVWSRGASWAAYTAGIADDPSVYGDTSPGVSVFAQINHCSTHVMFKSVFDEFLKVFARLVAESTGSLDATVSGGNQHQPHYALFLALLRLMEYARKYGNSLTGRHLDFYYREILGLHEKDALPGRVNLIVELAKQADSKDFAPGVRFKAGKDSSGKDAFFASDADTVVNQARVAVCRTVYRHGAELVNGSSIHQGRIFASPMADSDDGQGAPLISTDKSWHPFFNKVYVDGELSQIRMPQAHVGFAVASHYLLMAGGTREIQLGLTLSGYSAPKSTEFTDDLTCRLTSDKGWLTKDLTAAIWEQGKLFVIINVSGADGPLVGYSPKIHGQSFQTDLPMLVLELKHRDDVPYRYDELKDVVVESVSLRVSADNIRAIAASNDFGPVDTSKPFQPFGPSPVAGSSLVLGSKELFQKSLDYLEVTLPWLIAPNPYGSTVPLVAVDFLSQGQWQPASFPAATLAGGQFSFTSDLDLPVLDQPDFSADEPYSTHARQGYAKLKLTTDFGQQAYLADLLKFVRKDIPDQPAGPPAGPTASSLALSYRARSSWMLNSATEASYDARPGLFFHLAPFGVAEQHPYLNTSGRVPLLPQFKLGLGGSTSESEAEFYLGVSGLKPPQNIAVLFQVVDGTANPLAAKPVPHIGWSYLHKDEWSVLPANAVQDGTQEWLNAGIVTVAVPRDAVTGTYLDGALLWFKAAVHTASDAVCKMQLVAAQALGASFIDLGNAGDFSAAPLPAGTISKLAAPDSTVKSVTQPFATFGGRSSEEPRAFYTRVAERLRHKDRAITLWDYERLILEAFPQIYQVKCLNHTCYEPTSGGSGIYRELAPGHVTVVTIPNIKAQNLRDPLRPYTSLGLLQQVETFMKARCSCFAQLHVKSPQFEALRMSFRLRLLDGFDATYYSNLLKLSITRFLSPWAFDADTKPSFGGTIHQSKLIKFIEDQPYVDYVSDFRMFQSINGTEAAIGTEAQGSLAVSILVSAPADKHEVILITPASAATGDATCGCNA